MLRPWSLAVILALTAPALSGCLGGSRDDAGGANGGQTPSPGTSPAGPQIRHEVDRIEAFEVAGSDGSMLRGHIYVPTGTAPFPVILNYSPYWNAIDGHSEEQMVMVEGRRTMDGLFGTLLEAGFAIALINIRGTGESEGCNPWINPHEDGADAYIVIEALADLPWSNGNVGMVGISWHGYSQYAALADNPPSLKAVAPASAILDPWTLFTRRGPSINSQFGPMATTWLAFQALVGVGIYGDTPPSHLQCPEQLEAFRAFNQLNIDGDKYTFWSQRDAYDILDETEIPMFVTNGLSRFGEGHILQIDELWDVLPRERHLMIGQWPHAYPDDDRAEDYRNMLVGWFDHYLRGGPKTIETGIVEYQDDAQDWHIADRWPPTSTTTRLYLSGSGLVADANDVTPSESIFQSRYVDPRPGDCPDAGMVFYVTPPLAQDALLAGNFFSNVTVTSTTQNGNFGLFLWHIEDLLPCAEALADLQDLYALLEVSRALSDLRHRGTLEQGSPFPINEPDVMSMRSHPFASRVYAGERLILGVAGGAVELAPRPEQPLITVHAGEGIEGWIDLPVVEGELVFEA